MREYSGGDAMKSKHVALMFCSIVIFSLSLIYSCNGGGAVVQAQRYKVGGVVSGLTGTGLILRNNGTADLTLHSNGTFTFSTPLADRSGYNVTVWKQPFRQTCIVTNGAGTLNGADVTSVAINCPAPAYETVYISNKNAGTISVLDSYQSITLLKTITSGTTMGLATDNQLRKIYAANYDDNTVSVIDALTSAVVNTITVGVNPSSLGVNPADNSIYVSNFGGSSISVITYSAGTYTVSKTIACDSGPDGFAIDETTNKIYIPNYNAYTVSVIDAVSSTLTSTIAMNGQFPSGVAVDSSKKRLYVASGGGPYVEIIDTDTNTNLKNVFIGGAPRAIVANPSTNKVYATEGFTKVAVIDTTVGLEKVLYYITVGSAPNRLALSTTMNRLYVLNAYSDNVTIIDTTNDTVIDTIAVGTFPYGVTILSP